MFVLPPVGKIALIKSCLRRVAKIDGTTHTHARTRIENDSDTRLTDTWVGTVRKNTNIERQKERE